MHQVHRPCVSFRSLPLFAGLLATFVTGMGAGLRAGEQAIPLDDQAQIFVDDQFIARKEGVVRRVHPCQKLDGPVLKSREAWEQDGDDRRVYVYGTVLRDERSGEFRLWYNRGHRVHLATSSDGMNWERPRLGVCELAGSTDNNVVFDMFHSPSVVVNEAAPDGEDRYQMLGYATEPVRGYWAAHSADGIHWTAYPRNPVLTGGDTCTLAFDRRTGEYMAFHKRMGEHRGARRRLVYLATSRDMQEWSEPVLVMAPDEIDDAQVRKEGGRYSQFYNMSVFACGGQFLGFVTHFRYTGPPVRKGPLQSGDDGPVDVQLVHSRDGHTWNRCEDRSPVIALGPGAYDAGCILGVTNGLVTVGDQMWAYYTAITTTHAGFVPEKEISIGRAAWRLDGLVSLDADGDEGLVETVPLEPAGSALVINADAAGGELRVALLNVGGKPIQGFSYDDCLPLHADAVRHGVRWKTGGTMPPERPLRVGFRLAKARLYSYRFTAGSEPAGR
ncbi:MAG: glycoside hydrolase family protein [Thermoguttaceae bacterium]